MRRAACLFLAWLALLLALPFATISWFEATHRAAVLDPIERDHIHAASKFVHAFAAEHARFPDGEAFGAWARSMDKRGYRYDGNGFYLGTECAQTESDFCLGFWNGELCVTYSSGQSDKSVASIDGRAFDTLVNATVPLFLLATSVCFFVLARRANLRPRP